MKKMLHRYEGRLVEQIKHMMSVGADGRSGVDMPSELKSEIPTL